jgi:hypothetical protein
MKDSSEKEQSSLVKLFLLFLSGRCASDMKNSYANNRRLEDFIIPYNQNRSHPKSQEPAIPGQRTLRIGKTQTAVGRLDAAVGLGITSSPCGWIEGCFGHVQKSCQIVLRSLDCVTSVNTPPTVK